MHHNEYRTLANGYVVERYRVIGCPTDCYTVWVPSAPMGDHATITHIGDTCYGDYCTLRPSGDVLAAPVGSDERIAAVHAWYDRLVEEARTFVLQAYPSLYANTAGAYCHGYMKVGA